jgi:hypothetical protein
MKTRRSLELHPAGEGDFVFPTYGGAVRLSATEDALTPFGGLVPWAAFVRRCGWFETLSTSCPAVRTSPNAAPVYDVLQSYALTVLCDGDRFAHVQRLRADPTLAELFGVKSIVSDDTSDLAVEQASGWQIVELYRQRADTENVFDELKHRWGFDGFCSGKRNVTALAARLGLLVYNLWQLFLRLLEPGRHVESKGGRRWFAVAAAPPCGLPAAGCLAPLGLAHRRTAHAKRAAKAIFHRRRRGLVGAAQSRLSEDLPLAGANCAAVETTQRPRAGFRLPQTRNRMKSSPSNCGI